MRQPIGFANIVLSRGSHRKRDITTMCAMETVAWWAREEHSDHPICACPVIGAYVRWLNDEIDNTARQALKPYVPAVAQSLSTPAVEIRRALLLADWAIREVAPGALEMRGFSATAAYLRALLPITDRDTAKVAHNVAARASSAHASDVTAHTIASYSTATAAAAADAANNYPARDVRHATATATYAGIVYAAATRPGNYQGGRWASALSMLDRLLKEGN